MRGLFGALCAGAVRTWQTDPSPARAIGTDKQARAKGDVGQLAPLHAASARPWDDDAHSTTKAGQDQICHSWGQFPYDMVSQLPAKPDGGFELNGPVGDPRHMPKQMKQKTQEKLGVEEVQAERSARAISSSRNAGFASSGWASTSFEDPRQTRCETRVLSCISWAHGGRHR